MRALRRSQWDELVAEAGGLKAENGRLRAALAAALADAAAAHTPPPPPPLPMALDLDDDGSDALWLVGKGGGRAASAGASSGAASDAAFAVRGDDDALFGDGGALFDVDVVC
jgi:hypothetical protein